MRKQDELASLQERICHEMQESMCSTLKDEYRDTLVPWEAQEEQIRTEVRRGVDEYFERIPRGYGNLAVMVLRQRQTMGEAADELDPCLISDDLIPLLQDTAALKEEFEQGKTLQDIVGFSKEVLQEYFDQAVAFLDKHWYEEALDSFYFLSTLNPGFYEFWIGLGLAYQSLGKLEQAMDAYQTAVSVKPDDICSYTHVVECALLQGKNGLAEEISDVALGFAQSEHVQDPVFESEAKKLKAYVKAQV